MPPIPIAVIGLGRMGRIYARLLARQIEDARLAAVVDVRLEAARTVGETYGVPAYTEFEPVLSDPTIPAVIVATPTATHREVVTAAAQAGKAIFCEKPTALTLEETDAMLEAVDAAGVPFQIGFMRRFDAGYAAAKRQIDDGAIGRPVTFKSIGRDPFCPDLAYANPSVSGGLIVDMAIHDFDLARWLMGDEVTRVYAEGGVLAFPELATVGDIDNAVISLRFAGGALGQVEVSRNALYGYDIRTEVLGTEGALLIGYHRQTPVTVLTKEGACHDVVPYIWERFAPAYQAEIEHFVHCVCRGEVPLVTGRDGRAALAIALAATRSFHEGRPITLEEYTTV